MASNAQTALGGKTHISEFSATIPGDIVDLAFGSNSAVGVTAETVWEGGGVYQFPTAANNVSIVSTSPDDTFAGVGARTLEIYGLDSQWNLQREVISMAGISPVLSAKTWLRVLRVSVVLGGTPGVACSNVGTISVMHTGVLVARVSPTHGQSQAAIISTPATHRLLLSAVSIGTGKGKDIEAMVWTRDSMASDNASWRLRAAVNLYEGSFTQMFAPPLDLGPGTDVRICARNLAAGDVSVSAWANYVFREVQ